MSKEIIQKREQLQNELNEVEKEIIKQENFKSAEQRIESLELTLKGWQENEPDTERSKRIQADIRAELQYDYRLLQESEVNNEEL